MPPKELTAALKLAEERNLRFVNLQFTDVMGIVKSVQVPMHQLEEAVEHGKWFDGSSIEGFARIAESRHVPGPGPLDLRVDPLGAGPRPDGKASPPARARHLRRLHPERRPIPRRPALGPAAPARRGEEARLHAQHRPGAGVLPLRRNGDGESSRCRTTRPATSTSPTDLGTDVRKEMVNALEEIGIKVETAHHEVAIGQHEIDFEYADALRTADNAVTFKYDAQGDRAASHGLHATFMPKPIFGINGSGMHTHQSLWDVKTGQQRLRRRQGRLRPLADWRASSSPARWRTRAA